MKYVKIAQIDPLPPTATGYTEGDYRAHVARFVTQKMKYGEPVNLLFHWFDGGWKYGRIALKVRHIARHLVVFETAERRFSFRWDEVYQLLRGASFRDYCKDTQDIDENERLGV